MRRYLVTTSSGINDNWKIKSSISSRERERESHIYKGISGPTRAGPIRGTRTEVPEINTHTYLYSYSYIPAYSF